MQTTIKFSAIYKTAIEFALQDAKLSYVNGSKRNTFVVNADKKQICSAMLGRVSGEGYVIQ